MVVPEQRVAIEVMTVTVAEVALLPLLLAALLVLPLLHHLAFRNVAHCPRQHLHLGQAETAQPQLADCCSSRKYLLQ